MHKGAKVKR